MRAKAKTKERPKRKWDYPMHSFHPFRELHEYLRKLKDLWKVFLIAIAVSIATLCTVPMLILQLAIHL